MDTVTVLDGRRVRERFVELEVEALKGGADALPGLEASSSPPARHVETDGRRRSGRSVLPGRAGTTTALGAAVEHVRAMIVPDRRAHLPRPRYPARRGPRGAPPGTNGRGACARSARRLAAARPGLDRLPFELSWPGSAARSAPSATSTSSERLREEIADLEPGGAVCGGAHPALLEEERASARRDHASGMSAPATPSSRAGSGGGVRSRRSGRVGVGLRDIAAGRSSESPTAVRRLPRVSVQAGLHRCPDPASGQLPRSRGRACRARSSSQRRRFLQPHQLP